MRVPGEREARSGGLPRHAAPPLGHDTDAIRAERGFTEARIAALRQAHVI
jgi:crotonobetainyl-CoA:carnitine CoA-transferase CaiB-like acyl-CoA transferase